MKARASDGRFTLQQVRISELRYITIAVAIFTATYIFIDFNQLYALQYGVDTGIFLQSLVNFAHSGSTFNWVEQQPHLFVHDSWTLLLLAPLVALFPRPETLLVVQVIAVAAAAIPLYMFTRSLGLAALPAQCISLAYLISPSAQGWAFGNFSENDFVPLLAFLLAWAAARRSLVWTLIFAQLLLGIKEDQSWFLTWFGIAGALWYDKRLGASVAGLAVINGLAYYGIVHALGHAPARPEYHLHARFLPQDLAFLAEVLAPFAFAPLTLGWRILLAAPLVAELVLSGPWAYPVARAGTHWTVPLVTLIAIGAAVAVARRPSLATYAVWCSIVMALFFNVTVLHIGRHFCEPEQTDYARARAIAVSGREAIYTPDDEGAFVVASPNTNVRLIKRSIMLHPKKACMLPETR